MRIIHTCLRYPPATGGAETYIHEIVTRTRNVELKRDVRVITSAMRTHGPISYLAPDDLLDDPVYVQRLTVAKTPLISYPRLEALPYYIGHHRPDIIESYGFWYQPADVSARYAKQHNIPFIFHPIYYENDNRRKGVWQLYKKTVGQKTFAAADVVVVLSPYEQKIITDAKLPAKRIEIIPPGIDSGRFNASYLNPFLKRGIRGYIILAVSRLSPGKKVEDAVAAMAKVIKQEPTAQLVVIGDDFGSREKILELAQTLGVKNHIHLIGKLSNDEVTAAYQHANTFIHTSDYEAFGIVVADALAAGLPVIARNTSAIPYLVPHEVSGLLFDTADELANHILTYMNTPTFANHVAKHGQARVISEFTWDSSIKKLLKLYDEFKPKK